MPAHFFLDASALAKRFLVEKGSAEINHLFQQAPSNRLAVLKISSLEVISVLVRSRNRGSITLQQYQQASANLRAEIVNNVSLIRVSATDKRIAAAAKLIPKHSINATDALVLASSIELNGRLLAAGDSLVVVAADQRLHKAARAEGLVSFDPETQSLAELDVLLKS